jgi:hypothetical protein
MVNTRSPANHHIAVSRTPRLSDWLSPGGEGLHGSDAQQGHIVSYPQSEQQVPQAYPLGPIRAIVDQVLRELSPRFALLYSHTGRPSIWAEQWGWWALLFQAFCSVQSEWQRAGRLDCQLIFPWFVGLLRLPSC